ncbi:MAG TPA: DUF6285 domain-containing protein [Nevskiaceae bacterium]|nr:DUF6285 domain-containing protein [Nevskiaceae bacterium]
MSNRPTPAELLACVRESLASLATQADGATRFELKVAAHALEILAREWSSAPAAEAAETAALARLLGTEAPLPALRREACARLADGRLRHDDPALLDTLRAGVQARLAIDNPDFQEERRG